MLQLCNETERLAGMSAARIGGKPEDVIRAALEREAKALGVTDAPTKSILTVAEILTFGARAARRPQSSIPAGAGWKERQASTSGRLGKQILDFPTLQHVFIGILLLQLRKIEQLPPYCRQCRRLRQADGVEIGLRIMESKQEPHRLCIQSCKEVACQARPCVFQFDQANRFDGHAFKLFHERFFEFRK